MVPAQDYDALSDGSDLTGEDSGSERDMPSAPHTPSKKRRRLVRAVADDEDDDQDEDEVADQLDDDDEEEDGDADEDADELDEEEDDEDYDAPSTSKRGAARSSTRSSRASATLSTPNRPSRASARSSGAAAAAPSSTPQASGSKKSLRVKLTRTPAKEEPSPAASAKPRPSRGVTAAATPPVAKRAKADPSKAKWKPRAKGAKGSDDEDEIPIPASDDELLDDDDDLLPSNAVSALNSDDDDAGSASEPDEATAAEMAAIIGKTARQLAREGGVESEHLELPMFDPNRKKKLTENEIALRRSETARKRKNQVEKKLEDDKVETINRLLKKQVGRSRNKLPRAGSAEDSDEEAEKERKRGREEMSRKALKEMPMPFFRYIDREGGKVLAVPSGAPLVQEVWGPNYIEVNQALVQELDAPLKTEGLSGKAKTLEEKARSRLAQQAQQWNEDQQLEKVWGQEGLYEYKLRSALGKTRKQWIGDKRPPTPEVEEQPEEEEEEAAAEHEQEATEEAAEDAKADDMDESK